MFIKHRRVLEPDHNYNPCIPRYVLLSKYPPMIIYQCLKIIRWKYCFSKLTRMLICCGNMYCLLEYNNVENVLLFYLYRCTVPKITELNLNLNLET